MQCASFLRQYARSIFAALLLLTGVSAAYATDTYSPPNLSIPTVVIGGATFSNMVVTVSGIVSGPSGSSGNGSVDTYDPATNQLTIPNVLVGATTYHNVVITVGSLVSVASVTGADTYSPPDLLISSVQVGSQIYNNVTITVGSILAVANGMPGAIRDNFSGGQLTIPAVQVGARVFTNAVITVGSIVGVGGIDVPNVVGLTQAAASSAITAARLTLGAVSTASSPTVPAGDVISQNPAAGANAALGSAVALSVSTGAGGGGGIGGVGTGLGWFAFDATPTGATPTGQSGLFVLPANPLQATAANMEWVIQSPVVPIGAAFELTGLTAGSGFWPYAGFYAALDGNNIVEIYGLNLTNASASAPTPVSVGNFVAKHVTSLSLICDSTTIQSNELDATSWFAVIHVLGSGSCDDPHGDSWVVVTATTTTTVNITTTSIDTFYNPSGVLTGMVLNDPATNNILLYADKSFTSPTTLFTAATTDTTVHSQQLVSNSGVIGNGTVEFRELGKTTGSASVYRLDYTGASSFKAMPSYSPSTGSDSLSSDGVFTGTMADGVNFYFTDQNFTNSTTTLYQEPIGTAGSTPVAPIALYSGGVSPGFSVLGSNGSVVVLETIAFGAPSTSSLGSVPVGVAHTASQTPLGPAGGFTGSIDSTQMLGGSGTDFSHAAIFIDLTCPGAGCTTTTHPDSTGILTPANATLEALTPNSTFLIEENALSGSNSLLQIRGVTDTATPTDGGGKLYLVPDTDNAGSYTGSVFETCLTFSAGSCTSTGDFVVPANALLPAVIGLSSAGNATGILFINSVFSGMVANTSTHQIGVISVTNTDVEFAF
jgi:hypothetical protein